MSKEALELILALGGKPQTPGNEGGPFVLVPEGTEVHSLEHLLPFSPFQRENVTLTRPESLIDWCNRFKRPESVIFADQASEKFTAVLDYHGESDPALASFSGGKRAMVGAITLQKTPEWKTWLGITKQALGQIALAEFIEDNILDIIDPKGATMLEFAKNFRTRHKADFAEVVNLENGQSKVQYEETIEIKGQSSSSSKGEFLVPNQILLALQPYEGTPEKKNEDGSIVEGVSPGYEVVCRFRSRTANAKSIFYFEIVRPDLIVEDAFGKIAAKIAEKTGLPMFYGKPALPPG